MDYVKAFLFMRDDKNWVGKLLIGALMSFLSFLILPIFIVYGYGLAITRNVMRAEPLPMPEWNDWGKLLTEGVVLWLIQLVWAIPFVIVSFFAVIPVAISTAALDGTGSGGDAAIAGASILTLCLMFALGLLAALVVPPATILYARDGTFGAAFNVKEIIAIIREWWVQIIASWIAIFLASMVFAAILGLSVITICGPFILMFIGPVWLNFATSHLYGQIGFLHGGADFSGKFEL